MSDFMAQNNLHAFYTAITYLHWEFLNTEESRKKLDIRKKLEDYLKEFLGLVQPDRKFYLPETQEVLKSSIRNLDEFSVQKAITAFDWISQYANNLITKPWRKEFRTLKMYSGFYQHEIKANLPNAESLFEAMGYQSISEDILILDGPICPDQLANVSCDAMTAYIELQIIKHIYAGLDAIDLNFSLLDIYRYREKYSGSISQIVQALAYSVEEKRHRYRQKQLVDNYGFIDVQPSSNYFATNSQHCLQQCQCEHFQQFAPALRHRITAQSNGICSVPGHRQSAATNIVYDHMSKAVQYQHGHHPGISSEGEGAHLPHMSHSRSLEHYSEASNRNFNIMPQRHSFDHQLQECTANQNFHPHHLQQEREQQQQQHQYQHLHQQQHQNKNYYHHVKQHHQNLYESPYDYIDGNSTGGGSSNISYAAVAGANTSIRRASAGGVGSNSNLNSSSAYVHPYNISGNRDPLPLNCSNQLHVYNNPDFSSYSTPQVPVYEPLSEQQIYTSASKYQQNYMINANGANLNQSSNGLQNRLLLKDSLQGQPSFQSEQITNFKDLNVLQPATPHYYQGINASNDIMVDNRYSVSNGLEKALPPTTTSIGQQQFISGKPSTNGDTYAKPTVRDTGSQYEYNSGERKDTSVMSCESANGQICLNNKCNRISAPAQFARSLDGSCLTGNCNFQERNCSSKDLEKYNCVNVQSLNMESLNLNEDPMSRQNNAADKKICDYSGNVIKEREYTTDMSCESANNQTCLKNNRSRITSPAQFPKSHDGSGNTGYCNYQEKSSSSKDLDKNKDVNVQSLDMKSLDINKDHPTSYQNNSADKKISDYSRNEIRSAKQVQQLEPNEKNKSSGNENSLSANNSIDNAVHNASTSASTNFNKKKIKSALKPTTSKSNTNNTKYQSNRTQQKTSANKTFSKEMNYNNNNNESLKYRSNETMQRKSSPSSTVNTNKSLPNETTNTSVKEWSCFHCTYINSKNERICEMCAKTQDFKLDASTASTGGTTVARNTPTCV